MTRGILSLLLLASLGTFAIGQEDAFPGWDRIPTRDRLLAERAANVRGMRDLSREILNLRVGGGTIADLLGRTATEADTAGKVIEGYRTGEARFTGDGFARVPVVIATARIWENLTAIDPSISRAMKYADLVAAVGGEEMTVEGLGRPRGFPGDIRKHDVPPAPQPRETPRKHGALEPEEKDDRFAAEPRERALDDPRETPREERFADRRDAAPRERPLEDDFDSGWKTVQDTGWVTVSERIVKTWQDDTPCGCAGHSGTAAGDRWETIEERVIERRIVSEGVVIR